MLQRLWGVTVKRDTRAVLGMGVTGAIATSVNLTKSSGATSRFGMAVGSATQLVRRRSSKPLKLPCRSARIASLETLFKPCSEFSELGDGYGLHGSVWGLACGDVIFRSNAIPFSRETLGGVID